MTALREAVDRLGGVTSTAQKLGVRQSTVSNWFTRGAIPVERAVRLANEPGADVTVHDLRPDIFGPPPKAHEAA